MFLGKYKNILDFDFHWSLDKFVMADTINKICLDSEQDPSGLSFGANRGHTHEYFKINNFTHGSIINGLLLSST